MHMIGCVIRICCPIQFRQKICRRWLTPRHPVLHSSYPIKSTALVSASLPAATLPHHRVCEVSFNRGRRWPVAELSVSRGCMASEAPAEVPQLDRSQFATVLHLKALRLQASQCQDYVKAMSGCACMTCLPVNIISLATRLQAGMVSNHSIHSSLT